MRPLSAASYDLLQRAGFFNLLVSADQRERFTAAAMWQVVHGETIDPGSLIADSLPDRAREKLWTLSITDLPPIFAAISKALDEVNAAFVTTDTGDAPLV